MRGTSVYRSRVWPLIPLCAATAFGLTGAPCARAAQEAGGGWRISNPAADGTALQHRSIVVNGKKLSYTERAGFIPLRLPETGEVTGEIFFTAYTVDPVAGASPRPITFNWDGGPGGAATLSSSGPRTLARDGDKLVDNPATVLDLSDLVYVDEIGTGYSRMTDVKYRDLFYNTLGDAESVTEFIRIYLKRYDPSSTAPVFITGGSYGSIRAPLVAHIAARRHIIVRGLYMEGIGLDYSYPISDLSYALLIPTFTAAAHAHKKLPPDLQGDFQSALRQSEHWALGEYLSALARGNSLSES